MFHSIEQTLLADPGKCGSHRRWRGQIETQLGPWAQRRLSPLPMTDAMMLHDPRVASPSHRQATFGRPVQCLDEQGMAYGPPSGEAFVSRGLLATNK